MRTPAGSQQSGANPFPGLRSYEIREADLFFGRDDQRFELLDRLRRFRFLAVVGQSGCGKSSLVKAGVLASLRDGFMADSPDSWRIAVMRPGNDPLGHLAAALAEDDVLADADEARPVAQQRILTQLRMSSKGILRAFDYADLPEDARLLVLVDQFEEIFRYLEEAESRRESAAADGQAESVDWAETDTVDDFDLDDPALASETTRGEDARDDARAFVRLLLDAAADPDRRVYVLLTLRSSFLGNCTQFPELPEAINQGLYLVPRLNRDQLREAIVLPVEKTAGKGTISNRLVNRLLNDLGDDPDQLPILQHALMRMWQIWHGEGRRGPLDLEHYERTGRLEQSLEIHLNEIYLALDERHQLVAEQVFRNLTQVLDEDRLVRRPTRLRVILDQIQTTWQRDAAAGETQIQRGGNLEDDVRFVIDRFRAPGNSFLMPPASEMLLDPTIIDISHESLIRQWPKLREWTLEEHRSRKTLTTISEKCQNWIRSGRGLDRLLFGVELAEAEELWKLRPGLLSGEQEQFLSASLAERGREAKVRLRSWFFLTLALVLGIGVLIGIWLNVRLRSTHLQLQDQMVVTEKAKQSAEKATEDANRQKLELDRNLTQRRMSEGARYLSPAASQVDPLRALVWFAKAYPRTGEPVDDLLRIQLSSTLRHSPRLIGLLPEHDSPIIDAAVGDDHRVVFVRKDGTAWLWDLASGSLSPLRDQPDGPEDGGAAANAAAADSISEKQPSLATRAGMTEDGSTAIVVFQNPANTSAKLGGGGTTLTAVPCSFRTYPLRPEASAATPDLAALQREVSKAVDLGVVDLGRDGPLVAVDRWGRRIATKSGATIRVWDVDRGVVVASNDRGAASTSDASEPPKASQSAPKGADGIRADPHGQRDARGGPANTAVAEIPSVGVGGTAPLAEKEEGEARLVALDASGSMLAVAYDDRIAVYHVADGVVAKAREVGVKAASQLITSDAPEEIVALANQKIIAVAAGRQTGFVPPGDNESLTSMHAIVKAALGAGAKRILAEQQAGSVLLFDPHAAPPGSPVRLHAQFRHASHASFLSFGPEDRRILLAYDDGSATAWALNAVEIQTPGVSDVFAQGSQPLLLTPDGKIIACMIDGNGTLRCWNALGGELHSQFDHPANIAPLDDEIPADVSAWRRPFWRTRYLVDHGARFALVAKDDPRRAEIIDLSAKKALAHIAHSRPIEWAAFDPRNDVLATVSGREIRLWTLPEGQQLGDLVHKPLVGGEEIRDGADPDCRWKVRSIEFDRSGGRLLVLDADNQVVSWDVATRKQTGSIASRSPIDFVTPLWDDTVLVVHDDEARAFDLASSRPKYGFRHSQRILFACASPDEKLLATACEDGTASVRLRDDERSIVEVDVGAPVTMCRFSEDGRILATVSGDEVRLWDAKQGRPITPPMIHSGTVQDVRIPRGNHHLVTISAGKTWVWDLTLHAGDVDGLETWAALMAQEKLDELDRIVAIDPATLEEHRRTWMEHIRNRAVANVDGPSDAAARLAQWLGQPTETSGRRLRSHLSRLVDRGNPSLGELDAYLLATSTDNAPKTILDYLSTVGESLADRPYSRAWLVQHAVRRLVEQRGAVSHPPAPADSDLAPYSLTIRMELMAMLHADPADIVRELNEAIRAQPQNLLARFYRACLVDPALLDQRKEDLIAILALHPRFPGDTADSGAASRVDVSLLRLAREVLQASDERDGVGTLAEELDRVLETTGRRHWWMEEIQQSNDRDWLEFVYSNFGPTMDGSLGRTSFLAAFLGPGRSSDILRWAIGRVGELGAEGDALGERLRDLLAEQPWRNDRELDLWTYDLPGLLLNALANVWKERHPDDLTRTLEKSLREDVDGLGVVAASRLSEVSGAKPDVLASAIAALVRCMSAADLSQDERGQAAKETLATLLAAERNNPTSLSLAVVNGLKRAAACEAPPYCDHAAEVLVNAAVAFPDSDKLAFIGKFPTEAGIDRVSELSASSRDASDILLGLLDNEETTIRAAAACELVDLLGVNVPGKTMDALRGLVRSYLPEEMRLRVLDRFWRVADPQESLAVARELLASPDARNRQVGARKLGDLRDAASTAVSALEAALQDRSSEVQTEAGRALVRIAAGRPGFEAFWNTLSQHPNSDVRAAALRELVSGQLTPENLVLVERLKADPAEPVRISVLQAIAAAAPEKEQRIDALRGLLAAKSDPAIRKDAITRLGEFGYDAAGALDEVLVACKDANEEVQKEAVLAVVKIAWHSEEDVQRVKATVYDYPPTIQKMLAEKISSYGSAVPLYTPLLIDLLAPTREDNVQEWAAYALARIGPAASAAEPRLLEAVHDNYSVVRVEACRALWNIFQEKHQDLTFQTLQTELKAESSFARQLAAEILGTMGSIARPAVPDLVPLMSDASQGVRLSTAKALGQIGVGSEEVIEALVKGLADDEKNVRDESEKAIQNVASELGASRSSVVSLLDNPKSMAHAARLLWYFDADVDLVLPHLMEALAGEDSSDRAALVAALADMGPAAQPAVSLLTRYLDPASDDADFQEAIASALGKIGGDEALTALENLIRRSRGRPQVVAAEATLLLRQLSPAGLDALNAALVGSDENLTLRATQALAEAGDNQASGTVRGLLSALKHANPTIREWAADSLGKRGLSAEEAIPALAASLDDSTANVRQWSAYALQMLAPSDPSVAEKLVAMLNDEVANVRKDAARALGAIALPIAVGALTAALDDTESSVREAAALALGQLPEVNDAALVKLESLLDDPFGGVVYEAANTLVRLAPERLRKQVEDRLAKGIGVAATWREWLAASHMAEGNWAEAAAACDAGLSEEFLPYSQRRRLYTGKALALLCAGDKDKYIATCRTLIDQFPDLQHVRVDSFWLPWGPIPEDLARQSLPLAEAAARWRFRDPATLSQAAAIYYRAGNHRRAADLLEKSIRLRFRRDVSAVRDEIFLALVRHTMGRDDLAQDTLDLAQEWIDDNLAGKTDLASIAARPRKISWEDYVPLSLLLAELQSALQPDDAPAPAAPR